MPRVQPGEEHTSEIPCALKMALQLSLSILCLSLGKLMLYWFVGVFFPPPHINTELCACITEPVCSCSLDLIRYLLAYQPLLPDVILHVKGRATNSSATKIKYVAPQLNHRINWLAHTAPQLLS